METFDVAGRRMVVGDSVVKVEGQEFSGKVVAVFANRSGNTRIVVECEVPEVRGLLHIYRPDQMAVVEKVQTKVMSEGTKAALKASVDKWHRNVAAVRWEDVTVSSSSCALCNRHNVSNTARGVLDGVDYTLPEYGPGEERRDCVGCPVWKATGMSVCDGSPYRPATEALDAWKLAARVHGASSNEALEARNIFALRALDEYNFLKSLLPKEGRA